METRSIMTALQAMSEAIAAHEADVEALDRAIGDGDHLINLKRGYAALLGMRSGLLALPPAEAMKQMGLKLMATIGGASGPLLASFVLAWARVLAEAPAEDGLPLVARGFTAGAEAIRERGKADVGDKTMLDVLIPVSRLLTRLAQDGSPLEEVCAKVKEEAVSGMLATKEMVASRGRAHFLGERAIGHIDPGARTSQLAVCAVCDAVAAGHA